MFLRPNPASLKFREAQLTGLRGQTVIPFNTQDWENFDDLETPLDSVNISVRHFLKKPLQTNAPSGSRTERESIFVCGSKAKEGKVQIKNFCLDATALETGR